MANYTITVRFKPEETADGSYKTDFAIGDGAAGESADAMPAALGATSGGSVFDFLSKGASAFATVAVVKEVIKVGEQIFSYEINRVGRYTGSSHAQEVANTTLSLLSKIKNPIQSAIAYHYDREQREYERTWDNIGLELYRERSGGISTNRSRNER